MARKGSKRDPGRIALEWQNFCWHPTELDDKGRPKSRAKPLASGFEWLGGNGQFVTISVQHEADPTVKSSDVRAHEINLDEFIDGRTGRFTIALNPSEQMRSDGSAGPLTDSKGGQMNKFYDLLMRELRFDIEVDAAGEVTTPAGGPILAIRDPAPAKQPGRPQRPQPAPHGYVFIKREKSRGKIVRRLIQVDWKPDFIARHSPVFRPMRVSRDGRDIQEVILHVTDGPNVAGALRDFLLTTRKVKVTKKDDNGDPVMGPDDKPVKIKVDKDNTKGIHYTVDIDGHVFKLMHEGMGAFHSAHKRGVHIAAYGPVDEGAHAALTSIGIEHAVGPGKEWPASMIEASVDLVRELKHHFTLQPQNIVGHNDVICLKTERALPIETKACPGNSLPWEAYEKAGITLAPDADHTPPADLYGGVFQTGDVLDEKAPAAAIEEFQNDLRRIGWWLPGKKGGARQFGKFDDATKAGVDRFQTRYMGRQGIKHKKNKVDLATAMTLKKLVARLDQGS